MLLVGAQGPQLDRILRKAGVSREHFEIRPLEGFSRPQSADVIVAFGEAALQELVGEVNILRWRGRVVKGRTGQWVIPTIHPSELLPKRGKESYGALRNPPRFTGAVVWDIQRACSVADHGFTRLEPTYLCDPSPEEFGLWATQYEAALEKEDVLLSWDIETPYKLKEKDEDEFDESLRDAVILRISFAYAIGTGVSVPWTPQYLPTIRRLLRSRGTHVVWNGDAFDVPLVRSQGVEVAGEVHDYMWAWHLYQSDLPMGLEFVSSFWSDLLPWKHLNNVDPARYSAIDADAALRNAIGIRDALQRKGQWDTFKRHIVALDPLLYEAGQWGSKLDLDKQKALRETLSKLKAEKIAEAQPLVPEEIKPRKRYKKLPKAAGDEAVGGVGAEPATDDGAQEHDQEDHPHPPSIARKFVPVHVLGKVKVCEFCGSQVTSKSDHQKGKGNPCKKSVVTVQEGIVKEWDEILPFNPNSTEQIKSYIRHHGHPMGRAKDDKEKEAADSRHLEKLKKKYGDRHSLYGLTIDLHKISKALSTYVEGYRPDHLGVIHTTYTHAPSTWRLSSRNVNLQNVGKREGNKWAKDARRQITARPGHVLVQADSSAIEAVFVGHYMGSADYIALARKGVHAALAAYKLGLEFTPANVKVVKKDHKTLYDQCKITVHGTNYCMTPKLMVELFPDLFPSIGEAAEFQNAYCAMVPGLKRWQHTTRMRAHRETYLENPWKVRHYFYHVFMERWDGGVEQGGDANRAVAFLPQSSAGCFMKDNIVLLGETWAREFMPAHLSVHDSLCLDVPKELETRAIDTLVEILTRPIPETGGLQIGCEVECGLNWGEMESVKVVSIN